MTEQTQNPLDERKLVQKEIVESLKAKYERDDRIKKLRKLHDDHNALGQVTDLIDTGFNAIAIRCSFNQESRGFVDKLGEQIVRVLTASGGYVQLDIPDRPHFAAVAERILNSKNWEVPIPGEVPVPGNDTIRYRGRLTSALSGTSFGVERETIQVENPVDGVTEIVLERVVDKLDAGLRNALDG